MFQFLYVHSFLTNIIFHTPLDEIIFHKKHEHAKTFLKILLILKSTLANKNGLIFFDQIFIGGHNPFFLTIQNIHNAMTLGPSMKKLFFYRALKLNDKIVLTDNFMVTRGFQKVFIRIKHLLFSMLSPFKVRKNMICFCVITSI